MRNKRRLCIFEIRCCANIVRVSTACVVLFVYRGSAYKRVDYIGNNRRNAVVGGFKLLIKGTVNYITGGSCIFGRVICKHNAVILRRALKGFYKEVHLRLIHTHFPIFIINSVRALILVKRDYAQLVLFVVLIIIALIAFCVFISVLAVKL